MKQYCFLHSKKVLSTFFLLAISLFINLSVKAQSILTEDFERGLPTKSDPLESSVYLQNNYVWRISNVNRTSHVELGKLYAASLRLSAYIITPSINHPHELSFSVKGPSNSKSLSLQVLKSINGRNFEMVKTFSITNQYVSYRLAIDELNSDVRIKFLSVSTGSLNANIDLDNISVSGLSDLQVLNNTETIACGASVVDCGIVSALGQSVNKELVLKNTGSVPLKISNISFSSSYSSINQFPISIAPNQNYSLNVKFNPTKTGVTNGSILITSDAYLNRTCILNLTGSVTEDVHTNSCEPKDCNLLPNEGFDKISLNVPNTACGWTNANLTQESNNSCIHLNKNESSVPISLSPNTYKLHFYLKTSVNAKLKIYAKNAVNNSMQLLYERNNVSADWAWIELNDIVINKSYDTFVIKEDNGGEVLIDDIFFGYCNPSISCNLLEAFKEISLVNKEQKQLANFLPSKNYTLSFTEKINVQNAGQAIIKIYLASTTSTVRQKIYENITDIKINPHTVTLPFIKPNGVYDLIVFASETSNGEFVVSNVSLSNFVCVQTLPVIKKGCNLINNGEFDYVSGGLSIKDGNVYNWQNANGLDSDNKVIYYNNHLTPFNDYYSQVNSSSISASVETDCEKTYTLDYRYKGNSNSKLTFYLTNVSNVNELTDENSQLIFSDTIKNNTSATKHPQDYNIYNKAIWDNMLVEGIIPNDEYKNIMVVTEDGEVFLDEIILRESSCVTPCNTNLVVNGDFSLSRNNMFKDETYNWTGIVEENQQNAVESFGQMSDGSRYIQFQDGSSNKNQLVSVLTFAQLKLGKYYSIAFNYEKNQLTSKFSDAQFYVYLTNDTFDDVNIIDYVNNTSADAQLIYSSIAGFSTWRNINLNCIKTSGNYTKIVFVGRYGQFKVGNVVIKEKCPDESCEGVPTLDCQSNNCCNMVDNGNFEDANLSNWFTKSSTGISSPITSVISNNHFVALSDNSTLGNTAMALGAYTDDIESNSLYTIKFKLKSTNIKPGSAHLYVYLLSDNESSINLEDLIAGNSPNAQEIFNNPVESTFDWNDMQIPFVKPTKSFNKILFVVKGCGLAIDDLEIKPSRCGIDIDVPSVEHNCPENMVENGDFSIPNAGWLESLSVKQNSATYGIVEKIFGGGFVLTQVNTKAGYAYDFNYSMMGTFFMAYLITEDFSDILPVSIRSNSNFTNIHEIIPAQDKDYKYLIFIKGGFFSGKNFLDNVSLRLKDCEPTIIPECKDCIQSFAPIPGKEYILNAWVKESQYPQNLTYENAYIKLSFEGSTYTIDQIKASGAIIDGWQRVEQAFTVPEDATYINITLGNNGLGALNVYFDDIRVQPVDASMKSYVYDPVTLKLVAELDERNYATIYEYDEEGNLIRVKKETERGVKTIQESFTHIKTK